MRALERLMRAVDAFSEWTGRAVMWLAAAMVLITAYNVFERYFLGRNTTYLIELNWHLYSLVFLLGAAYTLKHDAHVRVDLIYHNLGPRGRAWVNAFGVLAFLLPVCIVVIWVSIVGRPLPLPNRPFPDWVPTWFDHSFVGRAWRFKQGSPDPGGLPYWYVLKTAIPVGFFFLSLQGVAELIRNVLFLSGRTPVAAPEPNVPPPPERKR